MRGVAMRYYCDLWPVNSGVRTVTSYILWQEWKLTTHMRYCLIPAHSTVGGVGGRSLGHTRNKTPGYEANQPSG